MSKKTLSLEHYTQYPNLAFHKIRQYINDGRLNEIDISVYYLILDQYYFVAAICEEKKTPVKNVSVSIQSIAEGLNISKTYAAERLKALHDVGLIFRVIAEDSVNGNKNTIPAIYYMKKTLIDNSYDYTPAIIEPRNAKIEIAAELKTHTAVDDDVPF
jgi:hypothetical protein